MFQHFQKMDYDSEYDSYERHNTQVQEHIRKQNSKEPYKCPKCPPGQSNIEFSYDGAKTVRCSTCKTTLKDNGVRIY